MRTPTPRLLQGNADAMTNLARLYEGGVGVPKDEAAARMLHRKAKPTPFRL